MCGYSTLDHNDHTLHLQIVSAIMVGCTVDSLSLPSSVCCCCTSCTSVSTSSLSSAGHIMPHALEPPTVHGCWIISFKQLRFLKICPKYATSFALLIQLTSLNTQDSFRIMCLSSSLFMITTYYLFQEFQLQSPAVTLLYSSMFKPRTQPLILAVLNSNSF